MSFNSFIGLFFSVGVIVLCWMLPKRFRNPMLLVASFVFYAYGDPIYLLLLLGVIVTGYVAAIFIEQGRAKRTTLIVAIVLLLGVLGLFKYFNFFTTSFAELLGQFGLQVETVTLRILLPIGISFYVFQTIGYLVDVYKRETPAERNFINFALFISFFPQLVAGPIERSKNLLRQVGADRPPLEKKDIAYGFFLIVQGYAKKIVIADNAGQYVDLLFRQEHLSAPLVIIGALLFAFQIYGDFSGYTDIARGYSRLLGFRIILNFDRPYFATSPSNFWRRWHISLSSWFTEYLYFSLGGNRSKNVVRRWSNVLTTMSLSGLWHGASLNFVLWGFYHGVLIVLQRAFGAIPALGRMNDRLDAYPTRVLTFIMMLYGWLIFRVEDFAKLKAYNAALVSDWSGVFEALLVLSQGTVLIIAALAIDLFEKYWLDVHGSEVRRFKGLTIYLAALIIFIVFFAAGSSGSFIYFRF